ncbi:MaoC family dehydratase N-terminal domain-containing protein [Alcaligenaceae bacterium]|nr:MaoC family dehydratase N-terminal domain-containing protein [Alcaligenaceae bacterium]
MLLSYGQLLDYDIPEVRQSYTARDAQLYALSVGVGQDPMDADDLRYIDERYGPLVLPSMSVVLGYPGFWLKTPGIGADTVRLLHGEQGVELFEPLPPGGHVSGKTSVTEAVDKGDKGLLLYSEKRLTDLDTGRLLARTFATHVLRGDGGMPGAPTQARPAHRIPSRPADGRVRISTRPEQALLYRLNGDYNPLHSDPEIARKAGYERPILHGLCTFGVVAQALRKILSSQGLGELRTLSLRFSAAVVPGETLELDIWNDGSVRGRVLERDVVAIDNGCWEPFPAADPATRSQPRPR